MDSKIEEMKVKKEKLSQETQKFKKEKEKLRADIDEHKQELKNKNQALMKVQKYEFQNSFAQNEIERGNIDPELVKEWQDQNDGTNPNSDDTSKDGDSDKEDDIQNKK